MGPHIIFSSINQVPYLKWDIFSLLLLLLQWKCLALLSGGRITQTTELARFAEMCVPTYYITQFHNPGDNSLNTTVNLWFVMKPGRLQLNMVGHVVFCDMGFYVKPTAFVWHQLTDIHTHAHTYTNTHIHTHTYTYTHMHTNIHSYKHIHTHTFTHTYTYIHKHTHVYTYTHTQTHIYRHTYIHIHTQTHTYTCPNTNTYTNAHTYIHIHKHTHTYAYTNTHIYRHTYINIHTHTHTFSAPWNFNTVHYCSVSTYIQTNHAL